MIADEVKMSADVVIWVNWSIERRFWYSPHHPPLGFVRLRLNRKTPPLEKDDIDEDEVNVDGNFSIWLPDNIGLPKYYWGCVTVGRSFFWIDGRKSSVSWKYQNKYQGHGQGIVKGNNPLSLVWFKWWSQWWGILKYFPQSRCILISHWSREKKQSSFII